MPIKDDVPMILRKEYRNPNALNSRSNGCSPSWSFRCSNRTHTEDIADTPAWLSQGQSSLNVSDFRGSDNFEIEVVSVGSSLSNAVQLPGNYKTNCADVLTANNSSQKEAEVKENSAFTRASNCSQVPAFDSFRSNNLSNAEEYQTLSSENWSTCSYSEVAISPQQSPLPSDSQTCMLCSKLLKERCQWDYDILTVAVLACGHVYHAGCLENVTPKSLIFDPNCPICYNYRKSKGKAAANAAASSSSSSSFSSKSRCKISRRAVVDVNVDGDFALDRNDRSSSSVSKIVKSKGSFDGSFLRRHFSFGSRVENVRKKKGLWARYR